MHDLTYSTMLQFLSENCGGSRGEAGQQGVVALKKTEKKGKMLII